MQVHTSAENSRWGTTAKGGVLYVPQIGRFVRRGFGVERVSWRFICQMFLNEWFDGEVSTFLAYVDIRRIHWFSLLCRSFKNASKYIVRAASLLAMCSQMRNAVSCMLLKIVRELIIPLLLAVSMHFETLVLIISCQSSSRTPSTPRACIAPPPPCGRKLARCLVPR